MKFCDNEGRVLYKKYGLFISALQKKYGKDVVEDAVSYFDRNLEFDESESVGDNICKTMISAD